MLLNYEVGRLMLDSRTSCRSLCHIQKKDSQPGVGVASIVSNVY